jgi:hypothetical protein
LWQRLDAATCGDFDANCDGDAKPDGDDAIYHLLQRRR